MKLLLDQGVPRSTVKHLAEAGITAKHVGDLGMAAATDQTIRGFAQDHEFIVVTLDADFHRLLAMSQAKTPSVIRVRIEGLKAKQLSGMLVDVVTAAGTALAAGLAVSVSEQEVLVRSLPIGG